VSRLAAVLACASCLAASSVDNTAAARAFVAGLNTPTRAASVRLLARSVRFRTLMNPWVRYAGRARAQFVESGFGTNCALRVARQSASQRVVRLEVEARRDDDHPCAGGRLATRVLFIFGFDDAGRIATLTVRNA
jgi:hypothetical protein